MKTTFYGFSMTFRNMHMKFTLLCVIWVLNSKATFLCDRKFAVKGTEFHESAIELFLRDIEMTI
jgi:hypothetical protein